MSILAEQMEIVRTTPTLGITGRVASATGMTVQVSGLPVPIGSMCEIVTAPDRSIPAEVIGFRQSATLLMPLFDAHGVTKGQPVRYVTSSQRMAVGPGLLGRVVDGMGLPCDGGPPIAADTHLPAAVQRPPNAVTRRRIDKPMSVGIRSMNALLTAGLRPAAGRVRRHRRRQERVAGHDGPLHGRRCRGGGTDRRARSRSRRLPGQGPGSRRPEAVRGGGQHFRSVAAHAYAGFLRRRCRRGVFSRPGRRCPAADGFGHAHGHGRAPDRPWPRASLRPPRDIRPACSPCSRSSWSEAAARRQARSPGCTPSWSRATT